MNNIHDKQIEAIEEALEKGLSRRETAEKILKAIKEIEMGAILADLEPKNEAEDAKVEQAIEDSREQ